MRLTRILFIALTITAIGGISLEAVANDATRNSEIAERFAKCDLNRDGKLTLEEAKGCMPRVYSNFNYLDSANKGYLTVQEIQKAADK